MTDNLPIGASNHSDAPYNEPLNVEHKRFVSVTISYYDTAYFPENTDEYIIKEELKNHIRRGSIPKKFDIDDFVVLEE